MATKTKQGLKKGQAVTWTSQSGGYTKTKTGKVIGFIPGDTSASAFNFPELGGSTRYQRQFQHWSGYDRYLVRVERTGKNGQKLEPYFYAPYAKVLERQNGVEV